MSGRVLVWVGVPVAVTAAVVLVVFWLVQGLEQGRVAGRVLSAFATLAAFRDGAASAVSFFPVGV
ncbi:hypothetical protein [Actinomadura rupiterrae]|uniref:hypothetical protein n=1 Tax=Actinomadura rupiterrae TaxID=559627 RepID=UPI0020A5361E|nr:hypothetical protein [Actinomadura rupiterrae]MCP2337342.1 negative regulator of sigma E activity [Actinomadura rupiterrae]